MPKTYTKIRQPKTIVRRISKIFYDTNFEKIDFNTLVDSVFAYMKDGKEVVLKANSSSGGGTSLVFIKDKTRDEIKDVFRKYKIDFTVQEVIVQHEVMSSLNSSTVNSLRLTTYLLGDEVVALAGLIKIGSAKARVDNYKHGGFLLGVDLENSQSYNWALDIKYNHATKLPSGVDLGENGLKLPFIEEAITAAKKAHYETPYIKMIGWDIAITSGGPVLIEANFNSDFRLHQAISGPIFGDYTEEILDELLLKNYSRM